MSPVWVWTLPISFPPPLQEWPVEERRTTDRIGTCKEGGALQQHLSCSRPPPALFHPCCLRGHLRWLTAGLIVDFQKDGMLPPGPLPGSLSKPTSSAGTAPRAQWGADWKSGGPWSQSDTLVSFATGTELGKGVEGRLPLSPMRKGSLVNANTLPELCI